MKFAFVLMAALAISMTPFAQGATWYVDAINGDDDNAGGVGDPWRTFEYANAQLVSAGGAQTLNLASGTYYVHDDLATGFNQFTLVGSLGTVIDFRRDAYYQIQDTASISNIEFRNGYNAGSGGCIDASGINLLTLNSVSFVNCEAGAGASALDVSDTQLVWVSGNAIGCNGQYTVLATSTSSFNMTLSSVEISDNFASDEIIRSGAEFVFFEAASIVENAAGNDIIRLDGSTAVDFSLFSTIRNNVGVAINLNGVGAISSEDNVRIHSNTGGNVPACGGATGCVACDVCGGGAGSGYCGFTTDFSTTGCVCTKLGPNIDFDTCSCPAGYTYDGVDCEPCPAGSWSQGGECIGCPATGLADDTHCEANLDVEDRFLVEELSALVDEYETTIESDLDDALATATATNSSAASAVVSLRPRINAVLADFAVGFENGAEYEGVQYCAEGYTLVSSGPAGEEEIFCDTWGYIGVQESSGLASALAGGLIVGIAVAAAGMTFFTVREPDVKVRKMQKVRAESVLAINPDAKTDETAKAPEGSKPAEPAKPAETEPAKPAEAPKPTEDAKPAEEAPKPAEDAKPAEEAPKPAEDKPAES